MLKNVRIQFRDHLKRRIKKIFAKCDRNKNKNRFYAWDFMQSLIRMIVILINGTG